MALPAGAQTFARLLEMYYSVVHVKHGFTLHQDAPKREEKGKDLELQS